MPVDEFHDKPALATTAKRYVAAEMLAVAALLGGFIGMVLWFDRIDFYHRHFFDTGAIVFADNMVRIVFVGIFAWLIYAPGAAIAALIMAPEARAALSPAERAVLGFGIGVGVWHVAMLLLGIFDLYYRAVMVAVCLIVLVVSARHFGRVAAAGWRAFAERVAVLRKDRASPPIVGAILIAIVAAWLLLRRALFPGGGGDYYEHYFYYYLEVLKHHGLAPNDVWYQYYYSKGSGLAFLGMLLTDPEAPALTTFPCVVCAAVAMATLLSRLSPNSLWPAAGALIYLLYYLLTYSADGGGEFQKDHEEITALIVLVMWALCMESVSSTRPFRFMATACGVAAAIITQPVGLLLGCYIGLLAAWSLLRRRWSDMWAHGVMAAAIGGAVLAVFVYSNAVTGLASDQFLKVTLYFANFPRLDRWGVIPMLLAEVWIRANYQVLVPPFGWGAVRELGEFMRLGGLWPFVLGPVVVAAILRAADWFGGGNLTPTRNASAASLAAATAGRLTALIGVLIAIALILGRAQSYSFARLSIFFVPLLVLWAIAATVWLLDGRQLARLGETWTAIVFPVALLAAVLALWQGKEHWLRRVPAETANALRFFSGRLSLAEAYTHATSGYAFGGINPGALAAAQQLPPGTPIWSTNVDSYCMVPGCLIESVVSFKLSGRLDDILGGDPELAKQHLQEAGLNYFLFMKDYRIIDLLPFSPLFAPDTIGRYLGVKWSDGSTYLLTWAGPDTRPLGPDFLEAYARRRAEPDPLHWFRFDALAPQLAAIVPRLRPLTTWGAADALLTSGQWK
jgi:hypothetical protein